MLSIFNLSGGTAQSGRSRCSIQAELLLNFAGRADFAERCTLLKAKNKKWDHDDIGIRFATLGNKTVVYSGALKNVDGFVLIREQFLPDKIGGAVVIPANQPEHVRLPQETVCRGKQPIHILPMQTEGGLTQQQR